MSVSGDTAVVGAQYDDDGGSNSGSAYVFDLDLPGGPPALSIIDDDAAVVEGDSGTTDAIFTVTLSAGSTDAVTVDYATADGSATAGEDYQATSGQLTFQPGQTQHTIAVPVFGDVNIEGDETFSVNLSNATGGATIADGQGEATILTDDHTLIPQAGDANGDGLFNSSDLVQVFQRGEYEDDIEDNSVWEDGDWDGDGDFTSSDLVMAFQTGLYEVQPQANASDIAAAVDWLFAHDQRAGRQRAYVA